MRVNLEILDYVNSKFRSLRIKTGHYRSLLLVCLLFPLVLLSCSAANNKQQLERPGFSNQTNGLIGTWGTFQIARPAKNASFLMKNMNTQSSGQSSEPFDVT